MCMDRMYGERERERERERDREREAMLYGINFVVESVSSNCIALLCCTVKCLKLCVIDSAMKCLCAMHLSNHAH